MMVEGHEKKLTNEWEIGMGPRHSQDLNSK